MRHMKKAMYVQKYKDAKVMSEMINEESYQSGDSEDDDGEDDEEENGEENVQKQSSDKRQGEEGLEGPKIKKSLTKTLKSAFKNFF